MTAARGIIPAMAQTVGPYYALTDQARRFVVLLSEIGDVAKAHELAGLAAEHHLSAGNQLLRRPEVMAALRLEMGRRLAIDATRAAAVVRELTANAAEAAKPGAKVRLDAAKTTLDRAGIIPPRAAAAKDGLDVPLNELSAADLRTLADKLEGELAARATPIEPTEPASTDQPVDLLG